MLLFDYNKCHKNKRRISNEAFKHAHFARIHEKRVYESGNG